MEFQKCRFEYNGKIKEKKIMKTKVKLLSGVLSAAIAVSIFGGFYNVKESV